MGETGALCVFDLPIVYQSITFLTILSFESSVNHLFFSGVFFFFSEQHFQLQDHT